VVVAAERGDLAGDEIDLVRDDRDSAHVDAEDSQLTAEVGGVGVDRLAGEDFVADEDDSRGLRHGPSRFYDQRPWLTGRDAMIQRNGGAVGRGGSSGVGEATSLALARAGLNIFGVHLDRKATLGNVERIVSEIKALGREAVFFNVNAADPEKRAEIVGQMERALEERGEAGTGFVGLHPPAFGGLKLYVADPMKEAVNQSQMDMTLDVMAHSLVYWTQEVVGRGLMTRGGRIYAMTSSGGTRVLPFYGPVSAAKAALESHIRQLAAE